MVGDLYQLYISPTPGIVSSVSSTVMSTDLWLPGDSVVVAELQSGDIYRPEFLDFVKSTIAALDGDLANLSQDIHCMSLQLKADQDTALTSIISTPGDTL